jgi:membrane-bound serine protease (ClpP class)
LRPACWESSRRQRDWSEPRRTGPRSNIDRARRKLSNQEKPIRSFCFSTERTSGSGNCSQLKHGVHTIIAGAGNSTAFYNDDKLAPGFPHRHSAWVIRGISKLLAAALAILAVGPALAESARKSGPPAKVVVIPINDAITKPVLYIIRRGLKEAIEQSVDTVVFDMETPGGQLDVTFDILKAIEKFPGKTVTYVNREAMSAGAFISASTDEIWFAPGGIIGAAAPVSADGTDIGETMRGKLVSYLKARMRAMSEGERYRGEVISAMIDMDSELKIGDEVIKGKGELLSLTAAEAMALHGDPPAPLLGSGIAENLTDLLDQLHGPGGYTVRTLEITWSERVAQYLNAITPVLMGLGLLALFIEFKTPGFGFFGITGLSLIGVVFFGQFAAGLSGHEPVLFFTLSVVLLGIELFFIPGGIVVGLVGAFLMFGSLVWAMTDLWPSQPIPLTGDVFFKPLANGIIGVVLAIVMFAALLRFLPQGGLWGHMILNAAIAGEPGGPRALVGGGDVPASASLVGETGVAVTALFPSGQVDIGGKRYEARLPVGFAEKGAPVKVTALSEFGLTVEVLS